MNDGAPPSQPRSSGRFPAWVSALLKAGVSAGLIAWLALHFDWTGAWQVLRHIHWAVGLGGVLLMALSQLLAARRLQVLLAAQRVPIDYLYSVRLTLVGLFASNFLPSTVGGDVVKIALLAHNRRNVALATASVVTDRLINLLGMVLLLPSVASLGSALDPRMLRLVEYSAGGLAVAGVVGVGMLVGLRRPLQRWLDALPDKGRLGAALHHAAHNLFDIAAVWISKPGVFLHALALSWGSVLLPMMATYVTARHLGIALSFIQVAGAVILIYFLALLPLSLNGLGLQEVSLVYLLSSLGTLPAQALALAVAIRLYLLVASLPGAIGPPAHRVDSDPLA